MHSAEQQLFLLLLLVASPLSFIFSCSTVFSSSSSILPIILICFCNCFCSSLYAFVHVQARLVARALSGRVTLPSQNQMLQDIADFYQLLTDSDVPVRYTHNQVTHKLMRKTQHTNQRVTEQSFMIMPDTSYSFVFSTHAPSSENAISHFHCYGCCRSSSSTFSRVLQ